MGATFGAGILGGLPVTDEATAVAMITPFVPASGAFEWREVIGERVGRWFGRFEPGTSIVDHDNFGFEWVQGDDAQDALEHSRVAGGSEPYGLFSFLDGFQVLTPCFDFPPVELPLELPSGRTIHLQTHTIESFVRHVGALNERLRAQGFTGDDRFSADAYLEFHERLVAEALRSRALKMPYYLGPLYD